MEMSDAVKSVEGSEREKERLATSPVLREVMSEEREMDGLAESLLEVSVACVAGLPARSETSAVMERVPSAREERSRFVRE